jgi:hypothetical protein
VAGYGRTIPDGVSVVNNVCRGNGWIGIYASTLIYPQGTDTENLVTEGRVVIEGNFCSGNGFDTEGEASLRAGIQARGYDLVVTGNVCYDNRGPQGVGIQVAGTRIVAADNVCRDNESHGIVVWGAGAPYAQAAEQITLSGNRCRGNALKGIYASGAGLPTTGIASRSPTGVASTPSSFPTSGVVVEGNTCEANGEDGLFLDRVQGVEVAGNTCRDNDLAGIRLFSYDRRTAVSNNVCLDNCRKDAWPHAGIHLADHYAGSEGVASREGRVEGNTSSRTGASSFQRYGIRVDGYRPIVIGNVLLGYTGVQGGGGINNASGGTAVLTGNIFDEVASDASGPGHSVVVDPSSAPSTSS